jgi:hypothetical protein
LKKVNKENLIIKVNLYLVMKMYIQEILGWEKSKVKKQGVYIFKQTNNPNR